MSRNSNSGKKNKYFYDAMNKAISMVVSAQSLYVKNPNTDFSRNRKLNLSTMIHLILSMQGNSLSKELYDYFKSQTITVTPSAFVQQRDKIKPELFKALFDIFNSLCNDNKIYKGYHLYAVDGSDINIPTNPECGIFYVQGCITNVPSYLRLRNIAFNVISAQ